MSQGLAQWIMALATLTTAIVVAVQSFSNRKTLNSQSREIRGYENSVIAVKLSSDKDDGIDRIQDMISLAATLRDTSKSADAYDWMEEAQPNPTSQPRAWLSEIYTAFDLFFTGIIDVNNRCAEIVFGKRRGLI